MDQEERCVDMDQEERCVDLDKEKRCDLGHKERRAVPNEEDRVSNTVNRLNAKVNKYSVYCMLFMSCVRIG